MLLDYFAERLRGKREQAELNPAPVADDSTQSILDIDSEPQGVGPLFGLHPPEGCVFDVKKESGNEFLLPYWHVDIVSEDGGLGYVSGFDTEPRGKRSDREVIISCAKDALMKYEEWAKEKSAIEQYTGTYPPKDTRNI